MVALRFIDRRVGFLRKPGRLSREKLCGRPTTEVEEEMKANNYPAGTYVNGGELINLEFSFVLDNANSAEKLLRAYRLITGLDEISTKL